MLNEVSSALGMPYYQSLIKDGTISQGEFDGTRKNIAVALAALQNTPHEKIEALVAENNDKLTAHMDNFSAKEQTDFLTGFREAQVMAGFVTTILAKAGIRE